MIFLSCFCHLEIRKEQIIAVWYFLLKFSSRVFVSFSPGLTFLSSFFWKRKKKKLTELKFHRVTIFLLIRVQFAYQTLGANKFCLSIIAYILVAIPFQRVPMIVMCHSTSRLLRFIRKLLNFSPDGSHRGIRLISSTYLEFLWRIFNSMGIKLRNK